MHNQIDDAREYWLFLKGKAALPLRPALDPVEIPKLLRHSCLIEVIGSGYDFRYLIIGSGIQMISRIGQTGQRVREIDSQKPPSRVFDLFTGTVESAAPQYCRLDYIGSVAGVEAVEVATFPFAQREDPDRVSHIWSIAIAELRKPQRVHR